MCGYCLNVSNHADYTGNILTNLQLPVITNKSSFWTCPLVHHPVILNGLLLLEQAEKNAEYAVRWNDNQCSQAMRNM